MKNSLSVDDICRIIKQCYESSVLELDISGLRIKFNSHRNESADDKGHVIGNESLTNNSSNANVINEQSLEDIEDAQLLIDDVIGFERRQIAKGLEAERIEKI